MFAADSSVGGLSDLGAGRLEGLLRLLLVDTGIADHQVCDPMVVFWSGEKFDD